MKYPDVMTVSELAKFLRLPRSSVYRLAREGAIPGVKVGRHWRFHLKAVEQWLGYSADKLQPNNLGAQYTSQESHDISEQSKLLGKFDVRVNQLATGKFRGRLDSVKTPQILMYKQYWGRKAEAFGVVPEDHIFLGASADSRGAGLHWCNTTLANQRFAVGTPGDDVDYVIANDCHVVALLIEPDTLVHTVGQQAFESLTSHRTAQFDSAASRRLIRAVTETINYYSQKPEPMDNSFDARAIESRLFEILNRCLETSGSQDQTESASRRRLYVRKAIARIESIDMPLTALELAQKVGVSQRTMNYAFQEEFDMTPCTYLQVHRLNAAHRELKRTDPQASSVTNIALKWGFGHAGRFSQLHKMFFNEAPSEALSQA